MENNLKQAKQKAIIFYTYLPPWRVDIFNEMGKMFDLTIVFTDAESEGFKYDRELLLANLHGIKTIFLQNGFKIKGKVFRRGILDIVKKYNPQIIFTHEYGPTSVFLALLLRLKTHSYQLIVTTSNNLLMAKKIAGLKKKVRNFVLSQCNGIVVYSKEVHNFYLTQYPKLNVQICPNIQNPSKILERENEYRKISVEYKIKYNLNKKTLLYVGRLEYVKGIDLLINAFNKSSLSNYTLIIVGAGSLEDDLKKQVLNLNCPTNVILFPGQFSGASLYAWYYLADYFVLSSRFEPFGAVVNEALILGCPVLASKNIGALEYIQDGENGLVFDPENESDFITTLNTMEKITTKKSKESLMIVSFHEYLSAFTKVLD